MGKPRLNRSICGLFHILGKDRVIEYDYWKYAAVVGYTPETAGSFA